MVQEVGLASGLLWMGTENSVHFGVFKPQAIESVASYYTNYAILTAC